MKITNLSKTPRDDLSVKVVIFGQFGIGKTSLLKTLDEPTLCLDCEAGLLSVQGSNIDVISLKSWEEVRESHVLFVAQIHQSNAINPIANNTMTTA